jgi:hypothetical protein
MKRPPKEKKKELGRRAAAEFQYRVTYSRSIKDMALFNKEDFSDLAIPIYDSNLAKNPIIKQVFGNPPSSDIPILIYVALIYDQKSPLRLKISNIQERKEEAAEMAGIKTDAADIFDLRDNNILGYINSYLRHQSSKVWSVLAANEEVLWQYQQELLTPIKDFKNDKDKLQALEIKTKLMQECDAIIKRIDAYEDKLFGDTKEKKSEILNLTPEAIANV